MDSASRIAYVIIAIIFIFAVLGIVFCIFIPMFSDILFPQGVAVWVMMVFLCLGAICGYWLLLEFFLIMCTVKNKNPFCMNNVHSLNRIAVCCGIACLDFVFLFAFYNSLLVLVVVFILAFGALCAKALSMVFRQAVLNKQEIDLTV